MRQAFPRVFSGINQAQMPPGTKRMRLYRSESVFTVSGDTVSFCEMPNRKAGVLSGCCGVTLSVFTVSELMTRETDVLLPAKAPLTEMIPKVRTAATENFFMTFFF